MATKVLAPVQDSPGTNPSPPARYIAQSPAAHHGTATTPLSVTDRAAELPEADPVTDDAAEVGGAADVCGGADGVTVTLTLASGWPAVPACSRRR
jgi:hypothetical protein